MNSSILLCGLLLGVLTRSLVHAGGDWFDAESIFWTTQLILSGAAGFVSLKQGFLKSLVLLVGAYISTNVYGYAFGSAEARAWVLLGAFSSLVVIFCYPVLAAILGWLVGVFARKFARTTVDIRSLERSRQESERP